MYSYDERSGSAIKFNGGWPGSQMTSEGDGWFVLEADTEWAQVIFNNNAGTQDPSGGTQAKGYECTGEVYIKDGKPVSMGKVVIKHVGTDGKVLSSETISGIADGTQTYTSSPKTFDGYTLQTTPANASGTITAGTTTVTYIYKAASTPLVNNSTVSSTSVSVGDKVTLTAKASGGTAPYTYALLYKKSTSSTWSKIGEKYGTTSTGSFKPSKAVDYDVQINVKDSAGTVKSKKFTIKVSESGGTTGGALVNNSTVSATSFSVGDKITLTGKASGGTSPYKYAFYYKKSTAGSWSVLGTEFGTATTATLKPGSATTYLVRIDVKDGKNAVESKSFALLAK